MRNENNNNELSKHSWIARWIVFTVLISIAWNIIYTIHYLIPKERMVSQRVNDIIKDKEYKCLEIVSDLINKSDKSL